MPTKRDAQHTRKQREHMTHPSGGGAAMGGVRGGGWKHQEGHTHTQSGSRLTLPLTDACSDRKHTADGELVRQ